MSIHSKALAQTSSPREPGSEGQDIPRLGGEEVLRPSVTVSVLVRCHRVAPLPHTKTSHLRRGYPSPERVAT